MLGNNANNKADLPENSVQDVKWDMRPFEELEKVGVLDPYGKNLNPLNGKEYSVEYKMGPTKERHWSKLPFNDPKAQKKTFEAIQKHQIILVKSGTGSGKSSQVPKFLSHLLGYKGRIAITIPTQVSTFSSAQYMAQALDVNLGEHVGYKFRGKRELNKNEVKSRIVFTTDGTILAQLLGTDPDLKNLNALVIDEAHKRSSNIDMILLLVKVLLTRRPDFKLLIVSATINAELFRDYFPSPEFTFAEVEVTSKPPFPITDVWADRPLETDSDKYISAAVTRVMRILTDTAKGDILVFLPTTNDLMQACRMLEEKNSMGLSFCVQASGDIFRSDSEQKELVIEQQTETDKRKVVMSTAVAEESITIKNIDFVVDSGLNLMSSYDAKREANVLDKKFITKSSAKQRAGRTGRLQPGTAYHLYTKKQFNTFPDYDVPEIKTINMAETILRITNMPLVGSYKKAMIFLDNLIEPPSREALMAGANQLKRLGVFTKKDPADMGELTVIGKAMAKLNMEPGVARTLLMSNQYFIRNKIVDIYSIMEATKGRGLGDLLAFARDRRDKYNKLKKWVSNKGDYFTMLRIYNEFEKYRKGHEWNQVKEWCRKHYLRWYPLSQVRRARMRLMRRLTDVVAPNRQENTELTEALKKEMNKEYKTDDARITHAILDGEGKIRRAKALKGNNKFRTELPPEKTVAMLSQDTMSTPKRVKEVVYNDLFIADGSARLNTVLFV